jgi:hypothetical protein
MSRRVGSPVAYNVSLAAFRLSTMNPTLKLLLVFAIACSLAVGPTFLLALAYLFPDSWRRTLREYQTLAGSLVTMFAAGLALTGVWMTVSTQTKNIEMEFAERRAMEDRTEAMHRSQIASAFVGEITVIVSVFRGEDWSRVAQRALDDLHNFKRASQTGNATTLRLAVSRPAPDYATFFRANAHEVGQFPQPIPQNLLMFYGIYTQLQDNLMQISRASDNDFNHMDAPSVEAALTLQLEQLHSLEGFGAVLIPELQKVADQQH